MLARAFFFVAAVAVGSPLTAQAQGGPAAGGTQEVSRLSPTELNMLTDARVAMVRIALQLTPEQQQYWPAVEEAIRARAEARYRRLATLRERSAQWREIDPVQLYRQRAEALTERAAGLKKLADAWQPLYQTLSPDQKTRMRLLTVRAVEGLAAAVNDRRMEAYDEDEGLE